MMKECAMDVGELFARILMVNPEDYIEPEKGSGTFELTGHLMNDFEKRIYTVFRQLITENEQIFKKIEADEISKKEMGKVKAELIVLDDKIRSIKHFFYFLISDRIKTWGCSLGVSKGWKIIIPDTEAEKAEIAVALNLPKEFRQLFEALSMSANSRTEPRDEAADNVANMARNMMRQKGNSVTH
ncbi:MAG: hypothetical protein HGA36_04685 [Candidatus Moranbacteria bacterium]|nr:hypothetical protein [Candidatus Moranbacteria bacterium]